MTPQVENDEVVFTGRCPTCGQCDVEKTLAEVRALVEKWRSGRFSSRHFGAHQTMTLISNLFPREEQPAPIGPEPADVDFVCWVDGCDAPSTGGTHYCEAHQP